MNADVLDVSIGWLAGETTPAHQIADANLAAWTAGYASCRARMIEWLDSQQDVQR